MEISQPPFTSRNTISAILLGIVAVGYWLTAWQMSVERQQAVRAGFDGEVNGLFVSLFSAIAVYNSLFFLATLPSALRRGTNPLSWAMLMLSLLPTLLLFSLLVVSLVR